MNIYPAIDILQGKAVRLRQGRANEVTVYGEPLEMAERWFRSGAEWLHVVDLDGAFEGTPKNHRVLTQIACGCPGLKIQIGGGIRGMAHLEDVFAAGVQRAILGTSAVADPDFVATALQSFGKWVAIGIDARDGTAKVS